MNARECICVTELMRSLITVYMTYIIYICHSRTSETLVLLFKILKYVALFMLCICMISRQSVVVRTVQQTGGNMPQSFWH